LLLNNRLVPPGQEPKSWADLLDPKWERKVIADDLRSLGAGAVFVAVMLDHFGEEFHHKFARQEPMLSMESRLNEPRVARGERPVYLPFPLANMPELRGLPVRAWVPREGTPYVRFDSAIIADAPRPNAARLFLNFLLTDEVQTLYSNRGFGPVVTGLNVDPKSEAAAFERMPLMGTTDPAKIEHVLEVAKVYGR
jgi:iron(III) transport system substrate-binding protein